MVTPVDHEKTDPPAQQEASIILYGLEQTLAAAGIASAKTDARCLLGMALGRDDAVLPHENIAPMDQVCTDRLAAMVARRLEGEPISRIRGWREFWSLRFAVSPATLDPRPDSEILIDAAVKWASLNAVKDRSLRLLDLGTGSGCLLLALLSELPKAHGVGIDINPNALVTARRNAASLGLGGRAVFAEYSFTDELGAFGDYDVILSNPPYIPTGEIDGLAVDVKSFDPTLALDGGADGMACWTRLLPRLAAVLAVNGMAFVEIGRGQENAVITAAEKVNLQFSDSYCDLAGITRGLAFSIKM
ncbi:peptide chain release factor N(5)-glutamine methyltransferase [Alphaproteobacteria bacterium]|nr:peptide chain release factor N(5)-glutamine methyltransferase [Alphaproteobacteria bacterium]